VILPLNFCQPKTVSRNQKRNKKSLVIHTIISTTTTTTTTTTMSYWMLASSPVYLTSASAMHAFEHAHVSVFDVCPVFD
jgi:hypothetical protein